MLDLGRDIHILGLPLNPVGAEAHHGRFQPILGCLLLQLLAVGLGLGGFEGAGRRGPRPNKLAAGTELANGLIRHRSYS